MFFFQSCLPVTWNSNFTLSVFCCRFFFFFSLQAEQKCHLSHKLDVGVQTVEAFSPHFPCFAFFFSSVSLPYLFLFFFRHNTFPLLPADLSVLCLHTSHPLSVKPAFPVLHLLSPFTPSLPVFLPPPPKKTLYLPRTPLLSVSLPRSKQSETSWEKLCMKTHPSLS